MTSTKKSKYKTKNGAVGQAFDQNKLRQLTLYIASRSEQDPRFGSVKLNKILFYSDFIHYVKIGDSITGSAYKRMPNGPCPENLPKLLESLDKKDELKLQQRSFYGKTQKRPIALIEADLSVFTAEEISTVDYVIQELWGKNASEASDLSHQFLGWQLAEEFATIPYSVARLETEFEATPFHYALAEQISQRLQTK
jgi:hypothetical protein